MRPLSALTVGLLLSALIGCASGKSTTQEDAPMAKEGAEPDHQEQGHSDMEGLGEASGHHGEGPLVHRFTEPAEYAKRWDSPERAAWQRPVEIIEAMEIMPGQTVADIGTGTGYFLPYLSAAVGDGGKVLALDIEPSMVAYVQERAKAEGLTPVEARVVPLDDPQLPERAVDRVLIVNTWHHIANRGDYIGLLRNGLTEKGSIYIVDFKVDSSHGPPKHHRLTPESVITEMESGGLGATLLDVDLPEQYIVKVTLP